MPPARNDFSRVELEAALGRAVDRFFSESPSLLDPAHPQGEVAVAHRIAHYLSNELELRAGVFVDVELHRDGTGLKPSPVGDFARIDIAVHRRDPANVGNLLAIEVKWADASQNDEQDARDKLAAYRRPRLQYTHAALLTLPRRRGEAVLEWIGELETEVVRLVLRTVGG